MKRTIILLTALAASAAVASPAFAWTYYGQAGKTSPSSSTSGGTTSTGGSTAVPEPGMLGLFGAGLVGLGLARRRKARD